MMIVVTPKINPDLDGYACSLAYTELLKKEGKEAIGIAAGQIQREIEFLNKEFGFERLPNNSKIIEKAKGIVLVDASSLKGLPIEIRAEKVVEVIDHRVAPRTNKLFPNAKIQIEEMGAAATLVGERFRGENINISKKATIFLHCAIASNTLNFNVDFVSVRDRTIFNWLKEKANTPDGLIRRMFEYKSQFDNKSFRKTITNDFKEIEINNKLIGIAQLEIIELEGVLGKRSKQLFEILGKLQKEKGLDFIFLTSVDLEKGINIFATHHNATKDLLEKLLDVSFKDNFAKKKSFLLRKQIIPMLKA